MLSYSCNKRDCAVLMTMFGTHGRDKMSQCASLMNR